MKGNIIMRKSERYSLIRLDERLKLNIIFDKVANDWGKPFGMNLFYLAMRRGEVISNNSFNTICSINLELNNSDLVYLFKIAQNRGLNVQIKPLENWLIRFPELSEIV
jgi:hypothetical protein